MNRISRIVSACAFAVGLAGCAGTQEVTRFPTQPVKIVVPYPAGNATDVVGRIVAEKLSQLWGQPVNVENRGGPTTVPGVDSVAKAKADGHTLLVHSVSYAVDAGLYTNLPYDPERDFAPVAPFARQPFALVASPSLGAKRPVSTWNSVDLPAPLGPSRATKRPLPSCRFRSATATRGP